MTCLRMKYPGPSLNVLLQEIFCLNCFIFHCPELVCHENADRIVDSSGRLTCECRKGFTGDGITDCTGQYIIYEQCNLSN